MSTFLTLVYTKLPMHLCLPSLRTRKKAQCGKNTNRIEAHFFYIDLSKNIYILGLGTFQFPKMAQYGSGFIIKPLLVVGIRKICIHCIHILCVQELVTHFLFSKLLYKMGHHFLDTQYISSTLSGMCSQMRIRIKSFLGPCHGSSISVFQRQATARIWIRNFMDPDSNFYFS